MSDQGRNLEDKFSHDAAQIQVALLKTQSTGIINHELDTFGVKTYDQLRFYGQSRFRVNGALKLQHNDMGINDI